MSWQQQPALFGVSPDLAAQAAILRRGPALLAWEVLRRDPGFRLAYHTQLGSSALGIAAANDFVARWGMHFR